MFESGGDECARRLRNKLTIELGEVVTSALHDPTVIEIMLNPDGRIWIERVGRGMEFAETSMEAGQSNLLLGTLAAMIGTAVSAEDPILETELPFCEGRFCGVVPPVVRAPAFCIRKPAIMQYTLEDYERAGIIDAALPTRAFAQIGPRIGQAAALRWAVETGKNILVTGGVGGGKTTLADMIVGLCPSDQRLLVIEDTRELKCVAPNSISLRMTPSVDMTRLVRTAMRLRPDRIIVGETRGPEILAMLKGWNTGQRGGLGTVHGNDVRDALTRVEQLVLEANVPLQPAMIAAAIDVIVFIERTPRGRVIRELAYLEGFSPSGYLLTYVAPDSRQLVEVV